MKITDSSQIFCITRRTAQILWRSTQKFEHLSRYKLQTRFCGELELRIWLTNTAGAVTVFEISFSFALIYFKMIQMLSPLMECLSQIQKKLSPHFVKYCEIFAKEDSVDEEGGSRSRRGISNFPAKYRVCSGLQDQ